MRVRKEAEGQDSNNKEWEFSASVAFLTRCGHFRDRLLLVQRRNGQWGLPAGRMRKGEHPIESSLREFYEETGLGVEGSELLNRRTIVIGIPEEDKTKLGIVFEAQFGGRLNLNGWPVDDPDGDIVFAKPFSKKEVMDLIDHPERINRPEFNQVLMIEFLLSFVSRAVWTPDLSHYLTHHSGHPPQYLEEWLLRKCSTGEIPGLSLGKDHVFGDRIFVYSLPPHQLVVKIL